MRRCRGPSETVAFSGDPCWAPADRTIGRRGRFVSVVYSVCKHPMLGWGFFKNNGGGIKKLSGSHVLSFKPWFRNCNEGFCHHPEISKWQANLANEGMLLIVFLNRRTLIHFIVQNPLQCLNLEIQKKATVNLLGKNPLDLTCFCVIMPDMIIYVKPKTQWKSYKVCWEVQANEISLHKFLRCKV